KLYLPPVSAKSGHHSLRFFLEYGYSRRNSRKSFSTYVRGRGIGERALFAKQANCDALLYRNCDNHFIIYVCFKRNTITRSGNYVDLNGVLTILSNCHFI